MVLVNKPAPQFVAPAVINGKEIVENFSLEQYFGKKYVLLFFYPKDFSPVCPSELWAFQEKLVEFEKRGVAIIGCSTDTEETHLVWLNTPKEKGGVQGITYPLVADVSKSIAYNYEILGGEYVQKEDGSLIFKGAPIALRATFLIDKQGIIRHMVVNDFALGRNIDEMIRMVDALQHNEKYGEACPANWEKGKPGIRVVR